MSDQLLRAIQAAKDGHRIAARQILLQVLNDDPDNEIAWLWMASVLDGERRRQSLERVMEINPENDLARRELEKLDLAPVEEDPVQVEPQQEEPAQIDVEETKICPYCAETIKAAAIVCRFCGRELVQRTTATPVARTTQKQDSKTSNRLGCALLSVVLVFGALWALSGLSSDANDISDRPIRPRPTVNISSYRSIDVRELDSYADRYTGDLVKLEGEVFNVVDDGIQIWIRKPGGDEWDTVAVAVTWDYSDILPFGVYEDTMVTVYGRVVGNMTGTNAFGAEINQPLILADRIVRR